MEQRKSPSVSDSKASVRAGSPIDLVHLARQTLGDRALQLEILRLFDQQISIYFARVRNSDDDHEIAMGLHTLKGASLGVGAGSLADIAKAAEFEFARQGSLDPEILDDMEMAIAELSAYINMLIARDEGRQAYDG